MSVRISVPLTKLEHELLKTVAAQEGISMSAFVRRALEVYFYKNGYVSWGELPDYPCWCNLRPRPCKKHPLDLEASLWYDK